MPVARLVDAIEFVLVETLELEVDTVLLFGLRLTETEIVVAFIAEFTAVKLGVLALSIGSEEKVEELTIIELDFVVCVWARAKDMEENEKGDGHENVCTNFFTQTCNPHASCGV